MALVGSRSRTWRKSCSASSKCFCRLTKERQGTWDLVDATGGVVSVCTNFDVFKVNEPDLQQRAIKQINEDFDHGLLL
jgi:hypothetical protein